MVGTDQTIENKSELRRRAESKLAQNHILTSEDPLRKLLHELMVHQIELEMQNENLLETKISESNALDRYTRLFDYSPIGICTLDSIGKISTINIAGAKILGLDRSKLSAHRLGAFIDNDYLITLNTSLAKAFSFVDNVGCDLLLNKETNSLWVQADFNLVNLGDECFVTLTNITERKQADEIIKKQAYFDNLTGLPNRNLLQDRLAQEIKNSQRTGKFMAMFLLDIDHFKDINDSLGHDMGDKLLVQVSARITNCIRDVDTLSRLGGDEFMLIMGDLDNIESAERVGESILNSLSIPFQLGDNLEYVSVSIGIVIFPEDGIEPETLFKKADIAMYEAKNEGRNCLRYFTAEMQEKVQKRLSLSHELRTALAKNQFWIVYQPIIELATGRLSKAEALIRWQHPQLGLVSPSEFIPIAEETGLIITIGDWVFKQVAQQTVKWRNNFCSDFQTSINKSPAEFNNNKNSHINWLNYLREIGLDSKGIVIEITESVLMEANDHIKGLLATFSESGVDISLDDFGTGYSSLAYLNKFDIDYIKIDQSFIKDLSLDSHTMALCEAIVVMAHKLSLKVIAEGVETNAQRDILVSIGCDYAQGYLFSKPVNAEQFEKLFVQKYIS